jgi:molybdopterin molybdotransferase
MQSVEAARARILAALSATPPETVALAEAAGRVLARPVTARLTQPPSAVSAMDGYALRAADAPLGTRLRVVGEAPAGHPFAGHLGPGEAVRIFTGAFIPQGADSILLQEDATAEAGTVLVRETLTPGRWVRPAGLDFSTGESLLQAGRKLTARDIGLAAAANHPWLTVHRRPRIGILATGDEIALPGDPLPMGGIVSSNAHALAAMLRAAGAEAVILPIAPDDADAIATLAQGARGCDMLVTTGGASVGEHDLVQKALIPGGFALDFWKIAMRPGKPLIWGRLGETPMLGLPGNPVSALVCAVVFLLPSVSVMAGLPAAATPSEAALTGADLAANDQREDYLRCRLDGEVATPFSRQDSSMLKTLARADALLIRAPHAAALPAGSAVRIIRLSALGV